MSNLYDHAYALARAMKESEEFKTLKAVQQEINKDQATKGMLDDFRSKQMELQLKQMQGEEISATELEKLQKLFEIINMNPAISKYFQIEQRFQIMVEDLNRIIFEPLSEIFDSEQNLNH